MRENRKKEQKQVLLSGGLRAWMGGFIDMAIKVLSDRKEESLTGKDDLAAFLRTTPEALEAFEKAYHREVISGWDVSYDGLPNAKQAAAGMERKVSADLEELIQKIVTELVSLTPVYRYDGKDVSVSDPSALPDHEMVTKEEVMAVPAPLRPECTGSLMKRDCAIREDENGKFLCSMYLKSKSQKLPLETRHYAYHKFRQGLDLLDLDGLMYAIIDRNQDSMGHWLPALVEAVKKQDYFKVPKTTVIKVPLTLLQLTRIEYATHTPTTLKIVDDYCYRVFRLDENETYFVRTGTSSSKFDFRNARVTGPKEVHELGEYLLYNHFRGVSLAGSTNTPCIYGMQTTVEWAVREYIEPKETVPEIYFGLPLRLEMRVFIDATEKKVLGIAPYWDPETMKKRFSLEDDYRNPDKVHDYVVYAAYEPVLMAKYEKYKEKVVSKVEALLPYLDLEGQWSLDVMFNGVNQDGSDDMYLIDMAPASHSALTEYIPDGLLKPCEEDWIPEIPELEKTKRMEEEGDAPCTNS